MYIRKVTIHNYRSFRTFEAQLQKLTVVIGENDTGKTNFFTALSLPLSGNQIDFNKKRLNISDINKDSVIEFFASVINNESTESQLNKIPKVSVTIEFADPRNSYETALLAKWVVSDGDVETYKIRYDFKPKEDTDLLEVVQKSLAGKVRLSMKRAGLPYPSSCMTTKSYPCKTKEQSVLATLDM